MTFRPPVPLPVAVLGATSLLGQHLVAHLAAHPWFDLVAVAESHVSPGSSSLSYARAVEWHWASDTFPTAVAMLPLLPCDPVAFPSVKVVFSTLSTPDAGKREAACAEAGMAVISIASHYQPACDLPLFLPSVNPGHAAALHLQRKQRSWSGWIVANPHPTAAALAHVLTPLQDAFGLEQVSVTPWQAVGGESQGHETAASAREARQIERETRHLLGGFDDEWGVLPASVRINVRGNLKRSQAYEIQVSLDSQASDEDLLVAWELGSRQETCLPSTPTRLLSYRQPLWLREAGKPRTKWEALEGLESMAVRLGQLRSASARTFTFNILAPNPLRSTARHALWQAEYLLRKGYIERWNWFHLLVGRRRDGDASRGRRCA